MMCVFTSSHKKVKELTERFGEIHCIQLIGISKISTNPGPCNLDADYKVFPHARLLPTGGVNPRDLVATSNHEDSLWD